MNKEIENLYHVNAPSIWGYPEVKLILLLQRINPEIKILLLTDTGINLKENYEHVENLDIRIPKTGQFITGKPIREQIEISSDELDKYDLVLALKDISDEEKDTDVVEHLLTNEKATLPLDQDQLNDRIEQSKEIEIIEFGQDSKKIIEHFYLTLRKEPHTISKKELLTLKKLAVAHTKLRLSQVVQNEDVEQAKDLVKYMLLQTCYEEDKKCFDVGLIR